MTERVGDNVVYIHEYLEKKTQPDMAAIKKRLADIGLEQLLLASERNRLLRQLETHPDNSPQQ